MTFLNAILCNVRMILQTLLGGTNVCHQSHPNTVMGSSTNKPAQARETLWCISSALCQFGNGVRSQRHGEVAALTRKSYLNPIFPSGLRN